MRKNSKHNQLQKNSSKCQIQSKFELANLSKSKQGPVSIFVILSTFEYR